MSLSDNTFTFVGGESQQIHAVGRYLRVRESTSPIYISINGGSELKRERGEQIDLGEKYRELRIFVRSVVAQSVHLISSADRQDDNRNTNVVTATATVESGNDNQHLAKVSVGPGVSAQIAGPNASRKSLRVSLLSDVVGYVTIGKSGVTATSGGTLEAGMVDYIDTTGALYAFNPNAVAVDVWSMEINKL